MSEVYIDGTIRERHVARPLVDTANPKVRRLAFHGRIRSYGYRMRHQRYDLTPCADCDGTKAIGYHHEPQPNCVDKKKHHPFRPRMMEGDSTEEETHGQSPGSLPPNTKGRVTTKGDRQEGSP